MVCNDVQYTILIHTEYSFLILFILFVIAIEFNDPNTINVAEAVFMVYALGFTLEKVAAMQEHGMKGIEVLEIART